MELGIYPMQYVDGSRSFRVGRAGQRIHPAPTGYVRSTSDIRGIILSISKRVALLPVISYTRATQGILLK